MQPVIVIPARMGSTRFPGKPLCDLNGKPMVQWVVEAARAAKVTDHIIVATPDQEIVSSCEKFGCKAMLTSADHATGTDRIAEVARALEGDIFINVQGDEPLIRPESILACANALLNDPSAQLSSIYSDCPEDEYDNPAVVKVVLAENGDALYFSRYPIPFPRQGRKLPVYKHVGLYGYRRKPLLEFSGWPMADIEHAESLEQLRFLYHGYRMRMAFGESTEVAVDTPDQAEQVRQILAGR